MPRAILKISHNTDNYSDAPWHAKPGSHMAVINSIKNVAGDRTRPLRASHVVALAESIAVLGLLEPLIVDTLGHLLAGAHRLAALRILATADEARRRSDFLYSCKEVDEDEAAPSGELKDLAARIDALDQAGFAAKYPGNKIPVQVMEITAKDKDALPLAIETAENSIRRQYTVPEIEVLATRLQKAGYVYEEKGGSPKKGQRSVRGALQAIVGLSDRHLRRVLSLKPQPMTSGKLPRTEWEKAVDALARASQRAIDQGKGERKAKARAIIEAAKQALEAITAGEGESE